MNFIEKQKHLQNLKNARDSFLHNASVYNNISQMFFELIDILEKNMNNDLTYLKTRSQTLTNKLKTQNLDIRKNFVENNKFNEYDLALLSGLLQKQITNNIPVLELFPGTGQFLPFAVAAEPLYIADRFIEICNEASKNLNNDFYATRRLRKYKIESDQTSDLPQLSFGLVYCFNEFFMCNEAYILDIAKQVFDLLYDGGKFIFNFMPSDQIWAQQLVFHNNFTIVDYKSLINELTIMGYTIVGYEIRQLKSSFIVAQKNSESTPRYKVGGGWAEIIDL